MSVNPNQFMELAETEIAKCFPGVDFSRFGREPFAIGGDLLGDQAHSVITLADHAFDRDSEIRFLIGTEHYGAVSGGVDLLANVKSGVYPVGAIALQVPLKGSGQYNPIAYGTFDLPFENVRRISLRGLQAPSRKYAGLKWEPTVIELAEEIEKMRLCEGLPKFIELISKHRDLTSLLMAA